MVYRYVFGVNSILRNYDVKALFNWKVILYVAPLLS